MQRRTIMRAAGLGLGALCGAGTPQAFGLAKRATDDAEAGAAAASSRRRVIVIGAGISGLAAAQRLRSAGLEVLVLEARDRLGGRVFTSDNWRGPAMDLGASWIHGAGPDNPIARLARQIGARLVATNGERAEGYDGDGGELSEAQNRRLDTIRSQVAAALSERDRSGRDRSLKSLVYGELDYDERSSMDQRMIDFVLNSSYEHEYGGAADRLSARWFDSDSTHEGEELLFLDGYQVLVNHLAAGLDIKLRHEVSAISYQGAAGVTVQTRQGIFTAHHAVVTLPLGVLKSGRVSFTPALPTGKRAAIDGLGVGVLNKCCLLFPQTFWDSRLDWLNHLPRQGQAGQWAEWVSFARPTQRPVLMGFNAADFGRRIERWDDATIVQSAMGALRAMFGQDIPAPEDALITRWDSDPHACGAYSCHVLGSTPNQRDDLAKSVNGRLFFAGEATERRHYQTVHGAYQSGLRAANEVLRLSLGSGIGTQGRPVGAASAGA